MSLKTKVRERGLSDLDVVFGMCVYLRRMIDFTEQ